MLELEKTESLYILFVPEEDPFEVVLDENDVIDFCKKYVVDQHLNDLKLVISCCFKLSCKNLYNKYLTEMTAMCRNTTINVAIKDLLFVSLEDMNDSLKAFICSITSNMMCLIPDEEIEGTLASNFEKGFSMIIKSNDDCLKTMIKNSKQLFKENLYNFLLNLLRE